MKQQRTNLYGTTGMAASSRIAAANKSTVPASEIDSLIFENAKLSERVKELTDKLDVHTTSPSMESTLDTILDARLDKFSADIKAALAVKQRTYEEQYILLEKKYQKLKDAQEQQFFKFSQIITSYQMLIFKMMSTQSTHEEVQKMNELMTEVVSPGPASSYQPPMTPHSSLAKTIRRHNSAVAFRMTDARVQHANNKSEKEEVLLSDNE